MFDTATGEVVTRVGLGKLLLVTAFTKSCAPKAGATSPTQ
jgi:hypothetical protein